MDRPRISLKDIAELAGVHVSTASRALDPARRALISDAVAERVLAAAAQHGYRRDLAAASLRTRRTLSIGVLVPDIANPVFASMLRGIDAELGARGWSTLIANTGGDDRRQAALLAAFVARRVDGIVVASARRGDDAAASLGPEGPPVVLLNRSDGSARLDAVVNDDAGGIAQAVAHLRGLGHRRIAHVAGPDDASTGFARRRAFVRAVRDAGGGRAHVVRTRAYVREEGRRAALQLLEMLPHPTAIVAANDLLAIGCLDALRDAGLRCPDDVSVTGFNDMPLADCIDPPLTTVHVDFDDGGRRAAALLVQRIDDPERPVRTEVLDARLVVRRSSAPPRD